MSTIWRFRQRFHSTLRFYTAQRCTAHRFTLTKSSRYIKRRETRGRGGRGKLVENYMWNGNEKLRAMRPRPVLLFPNINSNLVISSHRLLHTSVPPCYSGVRRKPGASRRIEVVATTMLIATRHGRSEVSSSMASSSSHCSSFDSPIDSDRRN